MAKSTYGTLQEFQPECEPIDAYLERVKAYFDANEIPATKRVAVLLSVIGPKAYAILRSLTAPETPQSKSLMKSLKNHYSQKPITIAERYHFHIRNQAPTENVTEYIAELRRLTSTCEFGTFLEEALRDRLVCGLRSDSTRKKLLTEPKLTLAKAVEFAQCMELADEDAKALKGTESSLKKLSAPSRKQGGFSGSLNPATDAVAQITMLTIVYSRRLLATIVTKKDTSLQPALKRGWKLVTLSISRLKKVITRATPMITNYTQYNRKRHTNYVDFRSRRTQAADGTRHRSSILCHL